MYRRASRRWRTRDGFAGNDRVSLRDEQGGNNLAHLREGWTRQSVSECEQVVEGLVIDPFLFRDKDLQGPPQSVPLRRNTSGASRTRAHLANQDDVRTRPSECSPSEGSEELGRLSSDSASVRERVERRGDSNSTIARRERRERRLGVTAPLVSVCIL